MSRLLLDTTFLIDAERGAPRRSAVMADDDDVAIAAITVAELRAGVLAATGHRRTTRRRYVDGVVETIPIVDYDVTIAEAHAELLAVVRTQGRPRGAHDLQIAATARSTGRTVLTADTTAFADLPGVEVRSHR